MAFGDHYLSQGATGSPSFVILAAGGTVCAGMSGVTCYIIFFGWQGQGWQLSQHGHRTLGALAGVMRHVTGGPFRTAVNMVLTADSLHRDTLAHKTFRGEDAKTPLGSMQTKLCGTCVVCCREDGLHVRCGFWCVRFGRFSYTFNSYEFLPHKNVSHSRYLH